MIPANELRIGNWVKIDPPEEGYPGICMVESISRTKAFLHCEEADYFIEKYIANIEPIPLTPEILEKCGFEGNRTGFYHFPNGKPYSLYFNNEQEGFLYFSDYDTNIKVQHLHQLQNLYFALTGEELEVKL